MIQPVTPDATTSLKGKLKLATHLGGTADAPTVLGLRETSGPTNLTNGDIADGEFLRRSGSSLVSDGALEAPVKTTVTSVSSDTTLTSAHAVVLVDASGAARTITLPAASGLSGRVYIVKKIDSSSNRVTVDGNASETIDDLADLVLKHQYDCVMLVCDGTEWWVVGAYGA